MSDMSVSEMRWKSFETFLSAFMEAAFTGGGLEWSEKREAELRTMVSQLRAAIREDTEDRLAVHARHAPHYYPEGPDA